eukprot:366549-Chlamydomonas_euryale.AAC.9
MPAHHASPLCQPTMPAHCASPPCQPIMPAHHASPPCRPTTPAHHATRARRTARRHLGRPPSPSATCVDHGCDPHARPSPCARLPCLAGGRPRRQHGGRPPGGRCQGHPRV